MIKHLCRGGTVCRPYPRIMLKPIKLIVFFILLSLPVLRCPAQTENTLAEEDGRYQLVLTTGRAAVNTRAPALVLDKMLGIVWTCKNIQDEKPVWIKNILTQNTEQSSRKKYTARILQIDYNVTADASTPPGFRGYKIPAIVIDIDEGNVWTCPNLIGDKIIWISKDLKEVPAAKQENDIPKLN